MIMIDSGRKAHGCNNYLGLTWFFPGGHAAPAIYPDAVGDVLLFEIINEPLLIVATTRKQHVTA